MRAAVAAGLRVIQVPDLKAPSDEFLKLGHEVLPSLTAVQSYLEKARLEKDCLNSKTPS